MQEKYYNNIIHILKSGGIILYPTDTIWGIGCDATNEKAIARIYKIKKRDDTKALISLVASKKHLSQHTKIIPKTSRNVPKTSLKHF